MGALGWNSRCCQGKLRGPEGKRRRFLAVLEAVSPRPWSWRGRVLARALFQLADASYHCILHGERKRGESCMPPHPPPRFKSTSPSHEGSTLTP